MVAINFDDLEELSIGGAAMAPVDTARDLGVTLDADT